MDLVLQGATGSEAAKAVGYSSRSGFAPMYRRLSGAKPPEWTSYEERRQSRLRDRVTEAEVLLRGTGLPIGQIAKALKYTHNGLVHATPC